MSRKRKLYVLSIDAMVTEDLPFMRTLPTLGRLLDGAAVVENILSVYPTLTYTIHSTMMTGVYPDRHHIVNNETFVPGLDRTPWYRNRRLFDEDVVTVLEAAKAAGYTTAAISWPVTADIDVDWHLPETWSPEGTPETMYDEFVRCGAKPEFLDEFWADYGRALNGLYDPQFSLLAHGATLAAIRNHQPDVLFEHLSMVDHTRHSFGVFAPPVYKDAYLEIELMLSQTLDAMRQAGTLEDTTIVLTSDHGQTPVTKLVAPNTLLVRDHWIRLNDDGTLAEYDIYFHSAAHSAQVYLSRPDDPALVAKAHALLLEYQRQEDSGIEAVLTRDELAQHHHLTGAFSFVVEARDGYSFANKLTGPLITPTDNSDYKYSVATHGHLPAKGPKPAMILTGPGIRPGVHIDGADIVDEAPTLAALLGVSLGRPDGKVLSQLLLEPPLD